MIEVANASIKSFASTMQGDSVAPSEEQIFVLTGSQLQEIINRAIQETTEPVLQEIQDFKNIVTRQAEKIAALEATAKHQEDNQFIQLQLISQLRESTRKEPQPMQRDRSEILRALLAANGGKMLAKDARKKMRISKSRMSELVAGMKDTIELRPYRLNRHWKVLVLRSSVELGT